MEPGDQLGELDRKRGAGTLDSVEDVARASHAGGESLEAQRDRRDSQDGGGTTPSPVSVVREWSTTRQLRPHEGAEAPLFERLLDGEPSSSPSRWHVRLERPAVAASVMRELSRLFNTRTRPGSRPGSDEQGTVVDFGVPDWSAVNPASAAELAALAETLSAKARAFEPRLEGVRVELEPDPVYRRRARGRLAGLLRLERTLEPVTFFLSLNTSINGAEIAVKEPGEQAGEAQEGTTCP